jgi:hypothetical protein
VRPDLPVPLVPRISDFVAADSAKAAGITAFVLKPPSKIEIARTIREVLDE